MVFNPSLSILWITSISNILATPSMSRTTMAWTETDKDMVLYFTGTSRFFSFYENSSKKCGRRQTTHPTRVILPFTFANTCVSWKASGRQRQCHVLYAAATSFYPSQTEVLKRRRWTSWRVSLNLPSSLNLGQCNAHVKWCWLKKKVQIHTYSKSAFTHTFLISITDNFFS